MNRDKLKLFINKADLLNYLKINGISGVAKDKLVADWENIQADIPEEIEETVFNDTKTSIVTDEYVETKEE